MPLYSALHQSTWYRNKRLPPRPRPVAYAEASAVLPGSWGTNQEQRSPNQFLGAWSRPRLAPALAVGAYEPSATANPSQPMTFQAIRSLPTPDP